MRLCDNLGNDIKTDDPIRETAALLKAGHIVAVKGLGGFHLAVDAQNETAVQRLRRRKHREEKPFALMSPDMETIQRYAHVRPSVEGARILRRSRGYVPVPVFLKHKAPSILACGAALKNTICLTRNDQAFLSQHIGDLDNPRTYAFFRQTIDHLKQILSITPEIIVHDLHPDYLSTRYAMEQPLEGLPRIAVQHHHAHIVSCMAENRIDGRVIGLAFDGTGYGEEGNIWGGEVLIADAAAFTRAAHLIYAPMPGGEAAIKALWRMAISYLYQTFGADFQNLDLPVWNPERPGSHTGSRGQDQMVVDIGDTAAPCAKNARDIRTHIRWIAHITWIARIAWIAR